MITFMNIKNVNARKCANTVIRLLLDNKDIDKNKKYFILYNAMGHYCPTPPVISGMNQLKKIGVVNEFAFDLHGVHVVVNQLKLNSLKESGMFNPTMPPD